MQLRNIRLQDALCAPLTEEDRQTLETIYGARLRLFVSVMLFLFLLANWQSGIFPPANFNSHELLVHGRYSGPPRYTNSPFTQGQQWIIIKLFLHLIIFIPSYFIFQRRIWAYRKDLLQGEKLVIYERIGYKQYFPITDQYFIGLEDAEYMHHEVDGETYQLLNEDDLFPVYFAPHSHYAFNPRGGFTAM